MGGKKTSLKIGILQCDDVLDKFQPEFGNYPQNFKQLFRRAQNDADIEISLEFEVYDVRVGEYPQTLDECDGYITTGSRHGVNDDLVWLDTLEDFLRQLYRAEKKFVGICFGHQMLAKALGGAVEHSERGWGVGVSFNQITTQQPWMEPAQQGLDLVVSHQDQVTKLPPNTQVLATSQFCPHYMIQVGDNMLGVQGHPEFTRPYSVALTNERRDRIPANRVREALHSLTSEVDDILMARWILNFFTC